jgi:hypothetical protein
MKIFLNEPKGGDQMKSLLGKLGVILIIIGLIIFGYIYPVVNIANAQSAWIVWKQMTIWNPAPSLTIWTIGKAFPTYNKCMDDVRDEVRAIIMVHRERKSPTEFGVTSKITGYGEDWISFKFTEDDGLVEWTSSNNFYCYPDTIDPRKK